MADRTGEPVALRLLLRHGQASRARSRQRHSQVRSERPSTTPCGPGLPTGRRRSDRRTPLCPSTAPGRPTPGGDGSRRWPRSSCSARPPSSHDRCTTAPRHRPPARVPPCGSSPRVVRAGPERPRPRGVRPTRRHRRRRARGGGAGRRARRRPVDPRRRGVARRPRPASPSPTPRRGRRCRGRHEPASTSSPTPTPLRRSPKAGGGWSALAGLVTAPGSRVRLVAHEPGGSGDGLLALGAVGEAVWLADGMDASADALSVAFPRTRIVAAEASAAARPSGRGRPRHRAGAARRHHHRAHGHRARRPHGTAALQLVPLRRGGRRPRPREGARRPPGRARRSRGRPAAR